MKDLLLTFLAAGTALAGMQGCAQIKKPAAQVKAAAVGSRFDQVGHVSLYAGEPCAPQIMFDFHGTRSTVCWQHRDVKRKSSPTRQTKTTASTFLENGDAAHNHGAATLKSRARSYEMNSNRIEKARRVSGRL